jgi:hypothetical protein
MSPLRVGLIAPKNSPAEKMWLLGYLRDVATEVYIPGRNYDLVWFLNVTPELPLIKAHTDSKVFAVCMEPNAKYPLNYAPEVLRLADRYMGYRNFSGRQDPEFYQQFVFPVVPRDVIREEFPRSINADRDFDFCLFATHNPNIRSQAGRIASRYRSFLGGPLFGNPVDDKLSAERRCRFEIISENDINDYYFSEKLGAALLAGCVPVYYGCRKIKKHVSPDLFIDMHDFATTSGIPDLEGVVAYCMRPGVYGRYFEAIRCRAQDVLLKQFTIESCLIEPVQAYLDRLVKEGFRSRRVPLGWRWRGIRELVARMVRKRR